MQYDTWHHIIEQCSARDTINLFKVCRYLHRFDNKHVWNMLARRGFGTCDEPPSLLGGWNGQPAYEYLRDLRHFRSVNPHYSATDNILRFEKRNIVVIDPKYRGFTMNVYKVDLQANKIRFIPEHFAVNASVLCLQYNYIEEIPVNWNPNIYLNFFYEINLSHNLIRELPEKWNPRNVDYLYLGYNNIVYIPPQWLKGSNVYELSLAHNPIQTLGDWIPPPSLKILNLIDCLIPRSEIEDFCARYPNISITYNKF